MDTVKTAIVMAAMKFVVKYFSEISIKSKHARSRLHASYPQETGDLQLTICAVCDQADNGIFPYCRRRTFRV